MITGVVHRRLRRLARLTIMAPIVFGASAGAANLAYELEAGVGRSDNIARTATNEIEEDIATAGLQFSLDHVTPRLEADLIGDFAYYDYLDDTYDSEVLGNFTGNATFNVIRDRLQWVVADNFGQVLTDPFEPATPDNREQINYFTTGPNIVMGFGSQTRLRLGARYSITTYEDSPFDSDSVLGEIELSRMLSSASSLGLSARAQQVEYDEAALDADYDQSEAFLRYHAEGVRTVLTVDAGYTEIDQEAADDSQSGLLLRLDVTRRLSASSTLALGLGREFSSSGAAFASTQAVTGVGLGATPGRQTVDPFTNEYVTLGWSYERNRTGFDLFGSWNDQSYESDPLFDQSLSTLSGSIYRDFSTRLRVQLGASYAEADFEEPNSNYEEISANATVSWRLSRSLSIGLTYDHFDRTSDIPDGGYKENRYWLSLTYGSGQPRARVRTPDFAIDAATSGAQQTP